VIHQTSMAADITKLLVFLGGTVACGANIVCLYEDSVFAPKYPNLEPLPQPRRRMLPQQRRQTNSIQWKWLMCVHLGVGGSDFVTFGPYEMDQMKSECMLLCWVSHVPCVYLQMLRVSDCLRKNYICLHVHMFGRTVAKPWYDSQWNDYMFMIAFSLKCVSVWFCIFTVHSLQALVLSASSCAWLFIPHHPHTIVSPLCYQILISWCFRHPKRLAASYFSLSETSN
jgi:hypothetical protein